MRNKRLKMLLESKGNLMKDATFLDCYNQQIFDDVAPTMTTRINSANHYFIVERKDENS